MERFDSQDSAEKDIEDVNKKMEEGKKDRLAEILAAPKIPRIYKQGASADNATRTL